MKSIKDVFKALDTSAEGLTSIEAALRIEKHGYNHIEEKKKTPLIIKYFSQFKNLFALLLLIAGFLAFIIGANPLGIAIFAIIFLNAGIGFIQEYRAEKAVDALRNILPSYAKVLRDGKETQILSKFVVPGDILILEEGDNICADGYLLECFEMSVNNSTLTGETAPQKKALTFSDNLLKTERHNMVLAGTSVLTGYGTAIVVANGMSTEFGKVASMTLEIEETPSPMQLEVAKVAKIDAVIAFSIATLFVVIALTFHMKLVDTLLFGLGIFVALIPEGLQATISVALAMGVQRMAKKKAIVKKLSAVETLGCTTVICADKTGTITTAEMTVKELFMDNKIFHVSGVGFKPEGEFLYNETKIPTHEFKNKHSLLLQAITFCNNSKIVQPTIQNAEWTTVGNPTEAALLVMAKKADFDYRKEMEDNKRSYEISFTHERKRMTSVHMMNDGKKLAFVKGSAKELISLSNKILINGKLILLTDKEKKDLLKKNDEFANKGLRVIGVAYKELKKESKRVEDIEKDLTFIALVGIIDPPREGVDIAIKKARSAGIKVFMITGDYELTAKSIAERVGLIVNNKPFILTGEDINDLSDDELLNILRKDGTIFARVSPEHKLRIVTLLKKNGEIVAVTGDGVNDAPALRKADIGIAMGIKGTDVAKEASDMVLMDDHFATIVNAIEEGRAVYDNIKKFTTYIFTSNWPELFPFIAFFLFHIPLPLLVIQILSIDLITDVLPSLALGSEPPEPGIMNRKPRNLKKERLLSLKLLLRSFYLGIFESIGSLGGCLLVWILGGWTLGEQLSYSDPLYQIGITVTLVAVICCQIANVFACRSETTSVFKMGFFKNKLVFWAILGELIIISTMIYIPVVNTFFDMHPLGLMEWLIAFAFAPILFFAEELRKFIVRKKQSKKSVAAIDLILTT